MKGIPACCKSCNADTKFQLSMIACWTATGNLYFWVYKCICNDCRQQRHHLTPLLRCAIAGGAVCPR